MAKGTRMAIRHQLDMTIQNLREAGKHVTYITDLAPEGHEQAKALMNAGLEALYQVSSIFEDVKDKW